MVDLHAHGPGFIPQPFRALLRALNPRRPHEVGFDVLRAAGVDIVVAKAVGDPVVTRLHLGRSPREAVEVQLARIERQATATGIPVVHSLGGALLARADGTPAVMLGVEGADALDGDIDRVDAWYERGIRVVVLIHLRDNELGSTCLPWQQYAGPLPARRRASRGLSPFGAKVVSRMNQLGILVDLAHADRPTLLDVVDTTIAPVVSSHTGARALQDFARYLSDDELRAIASTGGVIGLWPYRALRRGVRTIADLVAHAHHVAEVVGPGHLAIGTDMNGVPGLMAGYHDETDLPLLTAALLEAGFVADEVEGIVGGNAVRVLAEVESVAGRRP